jgi:predicted PurR-regulated permease PerM
MRRGAADLVIPLWILAGGSLVAMLAIGRPLLLPVVLAVLLFYALDPVVDRLQRWRVPRALGSTTVVLTLAGLVAGGALALWPQVDAILERVPAASRQLRAILREARAGTGPAAALRKVQEAAAAIDAAAAESSPESAKPARGTMRVEVTESFRVNDVLWAGGWGLASLLGQALSVLFLTTFLLIENDSFKRTLIRQFESRGSKRLTVQILADVAEQIERFMWVQGLTCTGVAVATGLGLWWLGVDQPAVWGVFAGVMNLVPFIGPLIVTGVVGTVAFLQFGTLGAAGGAALLTLVITSLEGHLITPHLLSRAASLNIVAILIAIAFWSFVWGVAGMLLAVPILMATKVVCDRIEGWNAVGEFLGDARAPDARRLEVSSAPSAP